MRTRAAELLPTQHSCFSQQVIQSTPRARALEDASSRRNFWPLLSKCRSAPPLRVLVSRSCTMCCAETLAISLLRVLCVGIDVSALRACHGHSPPLGHPGMLRSIDTPHDRAMQRPGNAYATENRYLLVLQAAVRTFTTSAPRQKKVTHHTACAILVTEPSSAGRRGRRCGRYRPAALAAAQAEPQRH